MQIRRLLQLCGVVKYNVRILSTQLATDTHVGYLYILLSKSYSQCCEMHIPEEHNPQFLVQACVFWVLAHLLFPNNPKSISK
jgi:hypothetical protein